MGYVSGAILGSPTPVDISLCLEIMPVKPTPIKIVWVARVLVYWLRLVVAKTAFGGELNMTNMGKNAVYLKYAYSNAVRW
jgi:hypothetical protein